MMRSLNANRQIRTPTSSQDLQKTKKIGITSSNSKGKNMSNSVTSMNSSLKKITSQNQTKSNKKAALSGISTSNSNKSLKGLRDITSSSTNSNLLYNKKTNNNNDKQPTDKKGAIPVKNIKQRICGVTIKDQNKGINPVGQKVYMQSMKTDPNICNIKQNHQQHHQTKPTFVNMNKHYYFNKQPLNHKDSKKTLKNTSNFNCQNNKSDLMNFTSALNNVEKQKENIKKSQMNLIKSDGLTLDRFQIGRKLGKGRFGDVYMARDLQSGFVLAIKMINKKQLKQSQMQKQLIQQIKIQMYSNHPNILKMYGFFADSKKIYLLLQLATNGCLFKQIRKNSYLKQNQASFYFRQVTAGVRYLHSNSVIHRDIKPQNILNCFNVLKLCDFGWAIYSPIYQRQTFCGTLDYVPPQIVTGEYYDQKADVWCLGVLCYQLCTGKAPFQSTTDQNQTYDKILKVNIQFPIYLSPQIVDFIGKILTRDPSKRLNLEAVQAHQWMRMYQNQAGRMISKQIWDRWIQLSKGC